jgi:hypothetical protein
VWDPAITDLTLTIFDWDQFSEDDVIGEFMSLIKIARFKEPTLQHFH